MKVSINEDNHYLVSFAVESFTLILHPHEWRKFYMQVKDAFTEGKSERVFYYEAEKNMLPWETALVTMERNDDSDPHVIFSFHEASHEENISNGSEENIVKGEVLCEDIEVSEEDIAMLFWRM